MPYPLDRDVTSSFILNNGKEATSGSAFLSYQRVRGDGIGVGAHLALLRQSRAALPDQLYRGGVQALHGWRFFASPADTGPEIPGLLAGGDQALLAGWPYRLTRGARAPEGHDAGEARATEGQHPGHRRNTKPAANKPAGVGIHSESDPGDANVTPQRLAQKILFRRAAPANRRSEQAVLHAG